MMKRLALYTNVISPHQLPLAREIVRMVGEGNYAYVYAEELPDERTKIGWSGKKCSWIVKVDDRRAKNALETADVLISGIRDLRLFERRAQKGLVTLYSSERWFKPRVGVLRLLYPGYFRMARRFVRLLTDSKVMWYYPMGIHAACDMARLCGLMHGDWRCLLGAPKLEFERKPGGRIFSRVEVEKGRSEGIDEGKRYCLDKMRMWGYFVESSKMKVENVKLKGVLRVLWVGRLLDWKCVDTIVRAVGELSTRQDIVLDIYGTGPEEKRLRKMAEKYGEKIWFYPPVPIGEVRKLMREHDVYVLSSNGYEGWGAVVSEALEEGMKVIGTFEAGASATMLPETCLFHSGDWKTLLKLLQGVIPGVGIGTWTARNAAQVLADLV